MPWAFPAFEDTVHGQTMNDDISVFFPSVFLVKWQADNTSVATVKIHLVVPVVILIDGGCWYTHLPHFDAGYPP